MSDDQFAHGEFWNHYSRTWEETVKPQVGDGVLGEEWAPPEHTRQLLERFAEPYLSGDGTVVEIGPGGGKFSRRLVERCRQLILVDISGEMLRRANEACGGRARKLEIADGDLGALEDDSVDLVFSYDVFIHLESEEIFRYFAEINRVLRRGGVFSVHTSTFLSRWGMHSFFQQLRDNRRFIGRRFGGRMYPMSAAILRRFAEHNGFTVIDQVADASHKDVVLALRKTRPARPWRFVTQGELAARWEISERAGGDDNRELYNGRRLEPPEQRLLLVGEADDPWFEAVATAPLPEHSGLPRPSPVERVAATAVVEYGLEECRTMAALLADPGAGSKFDPRALAAELIGALAAAHGAGLVHGVLDPRWLLVDVGRWRGALAGFVPAGEDADEVQRRDRSALAALLRSVAPAATGDLGESPSAAGLAAAARRLGEPGE